MCIAIQTHFVDWLVYRADLNNAYLDIFWANFKTQQHGMFQFLFLSRMSSRHCWSYNGYLKCKHAVLSRRDEDFLQSRESKGDCTQLKTALGNQVQFPEPRFGSNLGPKHYRNITDSDPTARVRVCNVSDMFWMQNTPQIQPTGTRFRTKATI